MVRVKPQNSAMRPHVSMPRSRARESSPSGSAVAVAIGALYTPVMPSRSSVLVALAAAALTVASACGADAADPGVVVIARDWPMPSAPGAGLPDPAAYDTATDGVVRDLVTGLAWQRAAGAGALWAGAGAACAALPSAALPGAGA